MHARSAHAFVGGWKRTDCSFRAADETSAHRLGGITVMSTTYLHAVSSLDGYIADEHDQVGPLHDWYFNGDHRIAEDDHADLHRGRRG